jgi:hypothetical protein
MAFQFSLATPPYYEGNMLTAIQRLTLTTNLKLCLDVGVAASYTSGQSWRDLAGSGYDFFRGADGSATSTDPTFNGVAGGQSASEYWSFDGGDYFTYDTTNEAWMQTLHKDNAVFSFAAWVNVASTAGSGIFGTNGTGAAATGISVQTDSVAVAVLAYNAGSIVVGASSGMAATAGSWMFLGGAFNETTNSAIFVKNGSSGTGSFTYGSPAAGNATYTMGLASTGNAAKPMVNGSRMASLSIWQGTQLTAANLINIYNLTRGRFGV